MAITVDVITFAVYIQMCFKILLGFTPRQIYYSTVQLWDSQNIWEVFLNTFMFEIFSDNNVL